jgi:hypothetical protein
LFIAVNSGSSSHALVRRATRIGARRFAAAGGATPEQRGGEIPGLTQRVYQGTRARTSANPRIGLCVIPPQMASQPVATSAVRARCVISRAFSAVKT